MRIIFINLAKACRAIGNLHVDAAEAWQRRAAYFDARSATFVSDNIAKVEPYDPAKHGEVRR